MGKRKVAKKKKRDKLVIGYPEEWVDLNKDTRDYIKAWVEGGINNGSENKEKER